jgi:thioredoxin reductase (NADPH)
MDFDCLIIGGGPAGLTAATYLGRFYRKVLVVDAGNSRAQQIPESHNYPGFADGISGPDLLRLLHKQARQYGADIVSGTVSSLQRGGEGFTARADKQGVVTAARVLMATGLTDTAPAMPGLRAAVAHAAVRYCPVCDAYEATGKTIAVFGSLKDAESKALFLRTYSRDITVLPDDDHVDAAAVKRLGQAGIAVASSAPADFRSAGDGIDVDLRDGGRLHIDVLYPSLGCKVHSDLAVALGARRTDVGCLEVTDKQLTSVDGIYAAGDVVSDLHQLSVAAGHAGIAATAIHRSLPDNFR